MRTLSILSAVLLGAPGIVRAQTSGATATGVSRDFNPAISVNSLFLGSGFSGLAGDSAAPPGDAEADEFLESGLRHQETEFQFTSTIDPYTSADFIFTFEDGEFGLEEGYVTSNVLPQGIGLRAGQIFVPLGQENMLHTHQLPFVQRSLFGGSMFGEALAEFGVEASWLTPLPWFTELRGAAFNGDDEGFFDGPDDWDLAYLGGLDALWDLTEGATFSVGADYLGGPNSSGAADDEAWSHLLSGVLRYKWRSPRRATQHSFEVLAEYLYAERDAALAAEKSIDRGLYAYANLKFARRWWIQGRYDWFDPQAETEASQRASFVLAFVPSEFGALRFQTSFVDAPDDSFQEFFLQYNFTIGSHPAHKY